MSLMRFHSCTGFCNLLSPRQHHNNTMDSFIAFGTSFSFTIIAFALFFGIFLAPILRKMEFSKALIALLTIHCLRTVGLMVIVPSVVGEISNPLPNEYAEAIAYGDLASAILALLCIVLIHFAKMKNMVLVWIFSLVGMGDLLLALINALRFDATSYTIGASWFTLNFFVPALWVTHIAIVLLLVRRKI